MHTPLLVVASGSIKGTAMRSCTDVFLCLLLSFCPCFLVSFLSQKGFLPFILTFCPKRLTEEKNGTSVTEEIASLLFHFLV